MGKSFSCATKAPNGSLFCWGSNAHGQHGDGSTVDKALPSTIGVGSAWTTISVGSMVVCGTAGGPVATLATQAALPPAPPLFNVPDCWGSNTDGQFGNGSTAGMRLSPTNSSSSSVWEYISLAETTACGIQRSVGALYCWGNDPYGLGALGDGEASSHYLPLQISGGGQWAHVFAANGWGCGIQANGSLFCWGQNSYGCLGDNSTITRSKPVPVAGVTTWSSLPPRGYSGSFTCAIRRDSLLFCWVRRSDPIPGPSSRHNNRDPPVRPQCRETMALGSLVTERGSVDPSQAWSPTLPGSP